MRQLLFYTLVPAATNQRDGAAMYHEEETEEALLDQVLISRPALVVVDVELASGDGLSACARLKANPLTRATAVVVVSGAYDRADFDRALAAGADGFLVKPFSPLRLRAAAEGLCREVQARVSRGTGAPQPAHGAPAHVLHPERYDLPPALRYHALAVQSHADEARSRRLAG